MNWWRHTQEQEDKQFGPIRSWSYEDLSGISHNKAPWKPHRFLLLPCKCKSTSFSSNKTFQTKTLGRRNMHRFKDGITKTFLKIWREREHQKCLWLPIRKPCWGALLLAILSLFDVQLLQSKANQWSWKMIRNVIWTGKLLSLLIYSGHMGASADVSGELNKESFLTKLLPFKNLEKV